MTKPKEMADDVLGPEIAAERLEELEALETLTLEQIEERDRLRAELRPDDTDVVRVEQLEALLEEAARERDAALRERDALEEDLDVLRREREQPSQAIDVRSLAQEVARVIVTDDQVSASLDQHRGKELAIEPDTVPSFYRYARSILGSPLLPEAVRNSVPGILHMLLRGRDLGLTPTASLSLHVMPLKNGQLKIEVPAQVIAAKVHEHPDCLYLELRESTRERATWATKRKRRDGSIPEMENVFTFDVEDAIAANYIEVKGEEPVPGPDGEERLRPIYGAVTRSDKEWAWKSANWTTQLRTMLRWRALTELARAIYPESTFDMYDRSEIPEPVDVTPPKAEEGSASSGRRVDGLKDRIRRRAEELDDAELVEGDSDHG